MLWRLTGSRRRRRRERWWDLRLVGLLPLQREALSEEVTHVIEEAASVTLLRPGQTLSVDDYGNLRISGQDAK